MGDGKEIFVMGEETVAISSVDGNLKLLHNVQYVPRLAHNLVSVGQLLSQGYDVMFGSGSCSIVERNSGEAGVNVKRMNNNMFPLKLTDTWVANMAVGKVSEAMMSHRRF